MHRNISSFFVLLLTFFCIIPLPSCAMTQPVDAFPQARISPYVQYPHQSCVKVRPIHAAGVLLDIKHQNQHVSYISRGTSNLCWAATISMVSTYLGNSRSICQVATYSAEIKGSCCDLTRDSPAHAIEQCNHGEILKPVLEKMGMYHLYTNGQLTKQDLELELSNGRPIILQVSYSKDIYGRAFTGEHVIVVSGFNPQGTFRVLNSNKHAEENLTYEQLQNGPVEKWSWYSTWHHFSYRIDGCNPRFQSCACEE